MHPLSRVLRQLAWDAGRSPPHSPLTSSGGSRHRCIMAMTLWVDDEQRGSLCALRVKVSCVLDGRSATVSGHTGPVACTGPEQLLQIAGRPAQARAAGWAERACGAHMQVRVHAWAWEACVPADLQAPVASASVCVCVPPPFSPQAARACSQTPCIKTRCTNAALTSPPWCTWLCSCVCLCESVLARLDRQQHLHLLFAFTYFALSAGLAESSQHVHAPVRAHTHIYTHIHTGTNTHLHAGGPRPRPWRPPPPCWS